MPQLSQRHDRRQSNASPDPSQAVGVVHVFVATEAAEDRLTKQSLQRVLAVLARARVNEFIADHQGQAEGIIEFAIGQQSGVGRNSRTVELQFRAAVEIQPQWLTFGITRRVTRVFLVVMMVFH